MSKRVFIVHGWGGDPQEGWFPWLKKELETRGFEVNVPTLPDTEYPKIDAWVTKLSEAVSEPNEQTYFVGHSMGCQTVIRYLQGLPVGVKVGGSVFVAGFFDELNGLNDMEKETAWEWLNIPIDYTAVKNRLEKNIAIFSDDDEFVPLANVEKFQDRLDSKIIIEHAKGHMGEESGVTELPSALDAVLELSAKLELE